MRSTRYLTWGFVLGGCIALAPLLLVPDQATGQAPRAEIIAVEGAVTTYQVEGAQGQLVTVDVPSAKTTDVKLSDAAQGTVHGKVVALDGDTNRVKIHTQEGQIIILALPNDAIMRMRLGEPFVLSLPRPAGR